MIYSIGYQGRTLQDLISVLQAHGVRTLVDVRSRPYGRRPEFNKTRITAPLQAAGIDYIWSGKYLGGFSPIQEGEIRSLAEWQENKTVCIMCMERDYKTCHRYSEIGKRLEKYGVQVEHLG